MKKWLLRVVRLLFGLFLYALGTVFAVQANVGLAPWDAFSAGIALRVPLSFGTIVILTGLVILGIDLLLREKIGLGTILNTLLIGVFVDAIQALELIPLCERMLPGVFMLLLGQLTICMGSFFYIGSAFGCGPRDALMVALGKRLKKVPIGVVRGGLEASVLLAGWLLGAKVGIGTVIAVFGIGFLLQATFHVLHFQVKAVEHESIVDTARLVAARFSKHHGQEPQNSGVTAALHDDEERA